VKDSKFIPIFVALLVLSACAELQTVRTTPDFITTAINPGDSVELVTTAGDRLKFEVTHVDENSIGSPEHLIALVEIKELYLVSKERPKVPCGGEEELGCSVPGKVKFVDAVLDEAVESIGLFGYVPGWHVQHGEKFYYACLQHDFCYRHGYKTYGHEKVSCDSEFYDDMLKICDGDIACRAAAKEFHWAVVEHPDEGAYQTETSTYCEYDGSVLTLGSE
jgi:hypothetical protein